MNEAPSFLTTKHLYLTLTRYILSLGMLPYALTKIFQTQFVLPAFSWAELESLELMSTKTLAWAFLGHSGWFQILLGFFELVPVLLLIFRRTTLLGASLMLPVTVSVFLINFALDLWTGTKIISSALLLLNILIFIFEFGKVKTIFKLILGISLPMRSPKTEIVANIIIISIASCFFGKPLVDYRSQRDELSGDWLNNHPLIWELKKEEIRDTIVEKNLKLYFGPGLMYKEFLDGEEIRGGTYELDTNNRHITFIDYDGKKEVCPYKRRTESELEIVRMDPEQKSRIKQYYWGRTIN